MASRAPGRMVRASDVSGRGGDLHHRKEEAVERDDRFGEETSQARGRISRKQLLKGLGGGFVAMGVLPVLGSRRAEDFDAGELSKRWAQIHELSGSVTVADTVHEGDSQSEIEHHMIAEATSTHVYFSCWGGVFDQGTLDEELIFSGSGRPREALYDES